MIAKEKTFEPLIEFYKFCLFKYPTNAYFHDVANDFENYISSYDIYKDARVYFNLFPGLFHIHDEIEFDHVAGYNLRSESDQ